MSNNQSGDDNTVTSFKCFQLPHTSVTRNKELIRVPRIVLYTQHIVIKRLAFINMVFFAPNQKLLLYVFNFSIRPFDTRCQLIRDWSLLSEQQCRQLATFFGVSTSVRLVPRALRISDLFPFSQFRLLESQQILWL